MIARLNESVQAATVRLTSADRLAMNDLSLARAGRELLQIVGTAVLALCVSELHAADSNAESLKQQIIAHAKTVGPDDYTFTRTVRVEQISGEKTEQKVIVDRWDPTKPADQRWSLVSTDGRAPTAEELKNYRKGSPERKVPNYGRVALYLSAAPTSGTDAQGRTVYRFTQLPAQTIMVAGTDLSASANGEATVNGTGPAAFVEQMRFTLTKSTRVKLVAQVERFESKTRYRLMPDGKPVPAEQTSDATGTMLSKSLRIRTTVTYTEQRPVRG